MKGGRPKQRGNKSERDNLKKAEPSPWKPTKRQKTGHSDNKAKNDANPSSPRTEKQMPKLECPTAPNGQRGTTRPRPEEVRRELQLPPRQHPDSQGSNEEEDHIEKDYSREARFRLKALTSWNSPGSRKKEPTKPPGKNIKTKKQGKRPNAQTNPQGSQDPIREQQIGPTTSTFNCNTQRSHMSKNLENLERAYWTRKDNLPLATMKNCRQGYAVLCDEPALFSDTGIWRLRNNRLSDFTTLRALLKSADSSTNEGNELTHAIIFDLQKNSTRKLDAYQGWNTNLNIIALRGEVEITESHGESLTPLATLRSDDGETTNTWEKWTAENKKHPQAQPKSYTTICPTTETAVWIELRSTKNMQRKGCNLPDCSYDPCGFSNHDDEES